MKKGKGAKRLLSVLLAVLMVLSTVTAGLFAFAADEPEEKQTINYVAIGDDEAAGINVKADGGKSYPEQVVDFYKDGGYDVTYSNYSQSYFGSNEIRKHLNLDGYKVPEKFKSSNDFVEWSWAESAGYGWNKKGNPEEDIKNADVITLNMGTNDFAYYTLFRVLDKMKFQMPEYPTGYLGLIGFGKGAAAEAKRNAYISMIKETAGEIIAFKKKADLEAALLKLQFVAPDSIQIDAEYETAKMQVENIYALKENLPDIFIFDTLTGVANLEKQEKEISVYIGRRDFKKNKAEAEKALSGLKYTEKGSIGKFSYKKAVNQYKEAIEAVKAVEPFMDVNELENYENIDLQGEAIAEYETSLFAAETKKLTYTSAEKINGKSDYLKAEEQLDKIKAIISEYAVLKVETTEEYKTFEAQEAAINQWKEEHLDELLEEARGKAQTAIDDLTYLSQEDIKTNHGFFGKYGDEFVKAVEQYKAAYDLIADYVNLGGNVEDLDTGNYLAQREAIIYCRKNRAGKGSSKSDNLQLSDFNEGKLLDGEPSSKIPAFPVAAKKTYAVKQAAVKETENIEEEKSIFGVRAVPFAAKKDIKNAEKALAALTFTEDGSIKSEEFLIQAEGQYRAASSALDKITDDKDKEALEGFEKFKKQGAVIEHYKNGEWHKNAERIQDETLAYSYRKTALVANAIGMGKDLAYIFASASKDVAKNYIKNYKALLKNIRKLNPDVQVIVVGLHNPFKNVVPGNVSVYVGKAVDSVNGALYDKTGYEFDVSTVFYDGGISSLISQGFDFIGSKIQAFTCRIRRSVAEVLNSIRCSLFGTPQKRPTPPEKPEKPEKTEKEIHKEREEAAEKAANEACAALTYLEPDTITNKSDLKVAEKQYKTACKALEAVLESRRPVIKGTDKIDKQRIAIDRFKYQSLDKKEIGKPLKTVISKANDYLEDAGTEAELENFRYIDASDVDTPAYELAPIIDFATSIDIEAIKASPVTNGKALLDSLGEFFDKAFGCGATDMLWKKNTKNPLFPTAEGHNQIASKFKSVLNESSYTKKNRPFGRRIKYGLFNLLFG